MVVAVVRRELTQGVREVLGQRCARSFGIDRATSPALVVNNRGREPLRSVTRPPGALITAGADHLGGFGLDQLLKHGAH